MIKEIIGLTMGIITWTFAILVIWNFKVVQKWIEEKLEQIFKVKE